MAKSFSGGLNSLFQQTKEKPQAEYSEEKKAKVKRGRPTTSTREITKSSQEGTREGETRATFICREDILETFKAIAHKERKELKKCMQEALEAFIAIRTPAQIKEAQKLYQESKQQ